MSFIEAQSSLIKVLDLFNFFPFKVDFDRVTSNARSFRKCILFMIFWILQFGISHYYFVEQIGGSYLSDGNPVTQLVTKIESSAIIVALITGIYGSFAHRMSQMNLLNKLLNIESRVRRMRFSRLQYNERLKRRVNGEVTFVAIFAVFSTTYFIILLLDNQKFFLYFLETFNYLLFAFSALCIIQFIRNVALTFGNLLDELSFNLKSHTKRNTINFDDEEVRSIFVTRSELIECIEAFNESFGYQIVGIFIYLFGVGTIEVYFTFSSIALMPSTDFTLAQILSYIGNVIAYSPLFVFLTFLGSACSSVKEAVINSNFAISKT
jgi:hypothetical protein